MPNPHFKRPARVRELVFCFCALATLLTAPAAHARYRWRFKPTISGTPPTTDVVGTPYSFTPTASGPSGYTLTFSISGMPAWASFSTATGQLSGTPTTANVGSFANITISVSDGVGQASLAPFTITVSAPASTASTNAPPTISGAPPTAATVGTPYSFTPSASDTDGDTLSFSVQNLPAWASFNTTTGQLSGTPATANIGSFTNITISVSDGTTSASLAPFTLTVSAPPNSAPTISGAPVTAATVGTPYSFTPSASDTDGDALSFSVQNLPAWAIFSIATGTVSGTPTTANVGTYSNIVISVSDGYSSASLAPFSISVSQPASSGTATLTWTAPTTNTNGSALTDLAGYHIYYGTSPSALSTVVDIANPATTTYTVSSLASGTWYFAVNAYTTSGVESSLSNTGSKSVP